MEFSETDGTMKSIGTVKTMKAKPTQMQNYETKYVILSG